VKSVLWLIKPISNLAGALLPFNNKWFVINGLLPTFPDSTKEVVISIYI
jgi:hypothetical protein